MFTWLKVAPGCFCIFPVQTKIFPCHLSPVRGVSAALRISELTIWQLRNCGMCFSPCQGLIFNKRKIVNILTDCLESWLNVYSAHSSLSRIALEFDWHTGDYLRKFTSKNSRLCKEAKGFKVLSKLNLGFNFHMILIVNCPRLEQTGCSWWGWTQVERLMYLKQVLISIYVPFIFTLE